MAGGPQAGGVAQQMTTAEKYADQAANPDKYRARYFDMRGDNQTVTQPPQIGSPPIGINPPSAPANINDLAAAGIKGAGAATVGEMGYTPGSVEAGQLANTDFSQYMNPYTQQVIDANQADILRGADIGLDALGAQANAASAFGGSRHGIAMGEVGRGIAEQLATSSSGLRERGFQNAQQAAMSDIGNRMTADQFNVNSGLQGSQNRLGAASQLGDISNLGFGMGQTVTKNLADDGRSQQAFEQALIDAAQGRFEGYTRQPASTIDYLSRAIGASPVPQTQTTTKQPGLFDYLTLGASMYKPGVGF